MITVTLLFVIIIFLYIFSFSGVQNPLIKSYSSIPKTINKKVHIIMSLTPVIQTVITNILKQTERADLMTIVVPEQYEMMIKNSNNNLYKFVKDTCIIQVGGGYSMLAKEREKDTILLYVKENVNSFKNPNTLKNLLLIMNKIKYYDSKDAICINNSIKMNINDAYNIF